MAQPQEMILDLGGRGETGHGKVETPQDNGTGGDPLREQAIRAICRVNLEGDGFSVLEAKDGAEALAAIRRQRPSLVLLDVMMPGVDGWSVAARLAADEKARDIPVVFLSARAADEDRLRAQELGAVGYVVKPFDPLELAGTVRDVLERVARGERDELNRELADPT